MVYTAEKTVKELEGKIDAATKSNIETQIADLKKALTGSDEQKIKNLMETLQRTLYDVSSKIYQQAGPQAPGGGEPDTSGGEAGGDSGPRHEPKKKSDEKVVDADYEIVDDDEKDKK